LATCDDSFFQTGCYAPAFWVVVDSPCGSNACKIVKTTVQLVFSRS